MATIGIIDADLVAGKQKRFPNLAAMKLSGYHKSKGDTVSLLPSFQYTSGCETVYVCCVFTESAAVPRNLPPNAVYGGTGFFFDESPPLPKEVEHAKPDYALYQKWLKTRAEEENTDYYTNASLGFLTRGCFRRCKFCVNRNSTASVAASPLSEFYDPSKDRICLLDDNVLACTAGYRLIADLVKTCEAEKKRFEFKQGIDMRLMQAKTAELFASSAHHGEVIFAFDSLGDADALRRGLTFFRESCPSKGAKAYVLCGFEGQDWHDIANAFRRIEILWSFGCLAYVMRHENYLKADVACKGIYTGLAAWANQPQMQRATSLRQFFNLSPADKYRRSLFTFERRYPEIAKRFFDLKYHDVTAHDKSPTPKRSRCS